MLIKRSYKIIKNAIEGMMRKYYEIKIYCKLNERINKNPRRQQLFNEERFLGGFPSEREGRGVIEGVVG